MTDGVAADGANTPATEEWRPIQGTDGFYSVSNLGRVRSEPIQTNVVGRQRGRVLSPCLDTKGYPFFRVCIPERQWNLKVHRAVAMAFLGAPTPGAQVNHKNGDKTDNRVDNLEYVSCRENIRHCWRHGLHGTTHCRGEANYHAKLTENDVRVIRTAHSTASTCELAARFGVTTRSILDVVQRKTWKHV